MASCVVRILLRTFSNRKTNAHCIIFQIYFLDLNSVNILWTLKTKETILCVPLDAGLIRNKTIKFFIDNTKSLQNPFGHLSSLPVLNGVRVAQSLVFYVVFCKSFFVLLFLFGHCIFCLSATYGVLLPPFRIFKHYLH